MIFQTPIAARSFGAAASIALFVGKYGLALQQAVRSQVERGRARLNQYVRGGGETQAIACASISINFNAAPAYVHQLVSRTRCHLIVGSTLMYYTEMPKKECWP